MVKGVPAKELSQWFSDFFIKKVDNTRIDLQTRQLQKSDNVPDVATAMSEVLVDFEPATPRKCEVSYGKLRISHVNLIGF